MNALRATLDQLCEQRESWNSTVQRLHALSQHQSGSDTAMGESPTPSQDVSVASAQDGPDAGWDSARSSTPQGRDDHTNMSMSAAAYTAPAVASNTGGGVSTAQGAIAATATLDQSETMSVTLPTFGQLVPSTSDSVMSTMPPHGLSTPLMGLNAMVSSTTPSQGTIPLAMPQQAFGASASMLQQQCLQQCIHLLQTMIALTPVVATTPPNAANHPQPIVGQATAASLAAPTLAHAPASYPFATAPTTVGPAMVHPTHIPQQVDQYTEYTPASASSSTKSKRRFRAEKREQAQKQTTPQLALTPSTELSSDSSQISRKKEPRRDPVKRQAQNRLSQQRLREKKVELQHQIDVVAAECAREEHLIRCLKQQLETLRSCPRPSMGQGASS
eukprot:m.367744 g.367744  ORF g.367744 m.367744 type:complete len:388 (-) comp42304_c0_seq1:271-1434(-)